MWWSDWYPKATGAVSGAVAASEGVMSSLWKSPPNADVNPDDPPAASELKTIDAVDLFGDIPATPSVQDKIAQRPKTWDEMSWYEKAWSYATDVVPGAVEDTAGVGRGVADSKREYGTSGAETPITVGKRAASA